MLTPKRSTNNLLSLPLFLLLLTTLIGISGSSCGIYSFTGASIDPKVKTASIGDIQLLAPVAPQRLTFILTEKLRNKISNEAHLNIRANKADIEYTGTITGYIVEPVASGGGSQAQLNRLTVSFRVEYNNNITKETWSQVFKQFENFDRNANLSDVETQLLEGITDRLTDEVFNRSFANW